MDRISAFIVLFVGAFIFRAQCGTVGDNTRRTSLQNALLSYTCKSSNGLLCNNRGRCIRGTCLCDEGTQGKTCETPREQPERTTVTPERGPGFDTVGPSLLSESSGQQIMACFGNNEGVCNGHGVCVDGTCLCEPQRTGVTCEVHNRIGFCGAYRSCAECTALRKECPANCFVATRFQLVRDFPILRGSFKRCRYRSSEDDCTFYFQLSSISATLVKNIDVKTCSKYQALTTTETTRGSDAINQGMSIITEVTTSRPDMTSHRTTTSMADPKNGEDKDIKDFCETHRECAECTAMFVPCPEKCAGKATYFLVFGFSLTGGSFHRCRYTNKKRNCNFYFQLDNSRSSGVKRIMIKTCFEYRSTTTPTQRGSDSSTRGPDMTSSSRPRKTEVTSSDDGATTAISRKKTKTNADGNTREDNNGNSAKSVVVSRSMLIIMPIFTLLYFIRY